MADEATEDDRGMAFARECLDNWTPRFVTNGVDYNELERVKARIDGWGDWCATFRDLGHAHVESGEAALDREDTESAAGHFVDAALCYHFGSFVWHEDDEYRDKTHALAVDAYRQAAPYLDPPADRLEAPTGEGFEIPGNLRVPDRDPDGGAGDSPLVVLLPGLDSIKEELTAYDPYFHARGLATLAVDGPAQGETWFERGMTPEYPAYISAMIDHVESTDPDGVDTDRLGIMGVSLGGFYAPYTAAHDPRVDACVGISGPFTVGPVSGRASDLSKEQYQWSCRTDSLVEVDEITESMSLRDVIEDLTAPSLMVTGAHDTIVPPAQTERIADRAPGGEFLLYPEGNHVCNNVPYKYKPRVADWLRDQLR